MWSNRWVRVGGVALALFLVNAITRLISRLAGPDDPAVDSLVTTNSTDRAVAVAGILVAVALMAVAAAWWAVRHPIGRVVADLGLATIVAALLALLIGPFIGGRTPFADGLEAFVLQFLQLLGLGALGIFVGFVTMVALGRDWKTRGLAAYAERYGRKAHRVSR